MTATEMAEGFLRQINQEHNFAIESWKIADWINKAQLELFNELYYNRSKKRSINATPPNAFEDSQYISRALGPFKRTAVATTNTIGFAPEPTPPAGETFAHYTAIGVVVNREDCPSEDFFFEAEYIRDNELFDKLRDPFDRPRYADTSSIIPFKFYYSEATILNSATSVFDEGIILYPNKELRLQIQYVIQPPLVAVQNFPIEAALYSTNPEYESNPIDINSLYPDFLHEEIVSRAVSLFSKSTPDYNAFQIEEAKINTGQV